MRRNDIDLVRIVLCTATIFGHALIIFSYEPLYHLKSAEISPLASAIHEFLRVVRVPCFFLIAGWSATRSLRGRTPGSFVMERLTRLLIPFIAGVVLLGSGIKYVELSHGIDLGFHGIRVAEPLNEMLGIAGPVGYFDFFPRNLKHLNWMTWSHLWFPAYLFLISLISLPVLMRLARRAQNKAVPSTMVVYLPSLLLIAVLVGFKGYWPYLPNLLQDWANFAYYFVFFAIGAVIAIWPGFEARLHEQARNMLVLFFLFMMGVLYFDESLPGRIFVGLAAWCGISALLGIAARIKPAETPALVYLREAALPVYILHHLPLLLIAAAVLPLEIPIWFKIAIITFGCAATTLAFYHVLVRPWTPTRFLVGMPILPSTERASTSSVERPTV